MHTGTLAGLGHDRESNQGSARPGSGINGGIGAAMDGGRGHAIFYVEVSNIAETLTVVDGRCGHKLTEPEQVP